MSFKLKTFFKIMIAWLVHGLQNVMISLFKYILSYLLANQSMYIILVILQIDDILDVIFKRNIFEHEKRNFVSPSGHVPFII